MDFFLRVMDFFLRVAEALEWCFMGADEKRIIGRIALSLIILIVFILLGCLFYH